MSRLSAKARAQLPNTAFAYVNSKGQRRLPIHDEAHVRNALARFNQIKFEDDAARERARKRLLTAAKKYGIVPLGFITGQLATERLEGEARGRDAVSRNLPTGQVTFLLTDIEDSTGLLRRVGDRYASLLGDVRRLLRFAVQRSGGSEVDARADELFAVFKRPAGALEAAIAIQRSLGSRAWPDEASLRVRIGIHTGRPTLTESGYTGLAVHTAARICAVGHGGQIVLSSATMRAVEASLPAGVALRQLGSLRLPGLPDPVTLLQLDANDLPTSFPPPRARRRFCRSASRPLGLGRVTLPRVESLLNQAREHLYGGGLSEFVPERKRLAADARRAGERAQAAAIGGLQKPTLAAWTLNQLCRRHRREVDLLLDAGHRLRQAQGRLGKSEGRAKFQQARIREREAIRKLSERVRQLLENERGEVSESVIVQVGESLRAVAGSDEARELLARGTFVKPLRPRAGFDLLESATDREEPAGEPQAPRSPTDAERRAVKDARAGHRAAVRESTIREREARKAEEHAEKLREALEQAAQAAAEARQRADAAAEQVAVAKAALDAAEQA